MACRSGRSLGCKCKGIGTCRFGHAWAGRELVLSASVKTSLCACATFVLTCLPTSMEHPVQNLVDRAARLQSAAPGGRAAAAVGEGDGKPRPLSCAPKRLTRPPGTLFMQADVASTWGRQAACLSPSLPSKGLQWHACQLNKAAGRPSALTPAFPLTLLQTSQRRLNTMGKLPSLWPPAWAWPQPSSPGRVPPPQRCPLPWVPGSRGMRQGLQHRASPLHVRQVTAAGMGEASMVVACASSTPHSPGERGRAGRKG